MVAVTVGTDDIGATVDDLTGATDPIIPTGATDGDITNALEKWLFET